MKKICLLAIIISLIAPLQSFASFTDVTEENAYYEAINYLESNGSISTNETFNPDTSIKRCEFFKMLLADAGFKPEDASGENHFTDITGDEWFAPYANKAAELGLIKVTSTNKTFNPEKEITKGEAAKLTILWGGFAAPMYLNEEDMATSYRDLTYKNIYAPYIEI
ncbi:MAG: S-layer homology domain-containing protein, partial [Candidatus Gracilibacteria bacterium]